MVSKLKALSAIALCLGLVGAWPNTGKIYSGSSPVTVAAYSGPGDVVTSARAWWGLRAYNNTVANAGATTTPVVDVFGVTTSTGCTIYLKGTGTGDLDLTTSGTGGVGHQCASGATTFCTVTNSSCTISKLYDQSGALNCNGSTPCNLIQAITADQPAFTFSGLSGLPVMTSSGSPKGLTTTNVLSDNPQPNTYVAVAENTAPSTEGTILFVNVFLQFDNGGTPNVGDVYAGNLLTAAAADNSWWALAGMTNGASSVMYVNGVATNGNAGTNDLGGNASPPSIFYFGNGPSSYLTGHIAEVGIWAIGLTSGQASNMSANQRAYWGF